MLSNTLKQFNNCQKDINRVCKFSCSNIIKILLELSLKKCQISVNYINKYFLN